MGNMLRSRDSIPVFIFSKSELHQDHQEESKIPLVAFEQPQKNPVELRDSSSSISIPPQVTDKRVESVSRLYDCATWNMYNRIMLHRRLKSESGARKEYPTSVTLSHFIKPKVEGRRKLVESNTQDTVKTPQECYCLDTKENDCLQFELDDD